jgi:hypothetical protein
MPKETIMVNEIVKSAKAQLSERIASPLIGSFVISWCLWNYKFFVILFSDASVSQTFLLVDTIVFPSIWLAILKGVFLPAATTFAYIFVYPYPAKYVYEFTRHRQKEINEVRQRIEGETLLTIEESRITRAEVLQTDKAHQEIVDRLNGEISRLKLEMTNGQPELPKVPPAVYKSSQNAVTPTQLAVLKLLENAGGKMNERSLIQSSKESKVKTEFDLGELVKLEMIKQRSDMRTGEVTYEFLHEGRRILLDSAHYAA